MHLQPLGHLLADLLIFACAKIHGLEIAHDGTHFDELMTLEA